MQDCMGSENGKQLEQITSWQLKARMDERTDERTEKSAPTKFINLKIVSTY